MPHQGVPWVGGISLLKVLWSQRPPSLASAEPPEKFVENPVSGATVSVGFQQAAHRF